ncbi:hypothetical protein [Pseudocitrobacter sp. 73]|uniref:hypothetical protein n=1 Tax=Pseudocitrobacter sp. 73 TaxID=2605731 RepID=UPI0011EC40C9|nr:hypothetical protein [Pseudocitrobacter sp. 73]KAA1048590.1 hypothetical protein F0Q32_14270 [Pseudocitrobacter sp. 73]
MSKPKTDTYDVVYSSIRRITKLRTVEGEIRFTGTMKLIYAYIWTFQENKKRGNDDPIHTNTNVIAWEVGVSEKAAIDALKALDTAKVVRKATVKVRGNVNSSNYVAIPPASVAVRGVTPPHPDEVKSKPKKKAAKPKIEESENGVQQQEHEQKPATVAPAPATNVSEQQSGIQQPDGDSGDDVSANDAVNCVESPRQKASFKPTEPDDDSDDYQGEGYQGNGGGIEPEAYPEPTQAEIDYALANL